MYAANCQRDRRYLWGRLRSICLILQGPRVVMGDFSAIRNSSEAYRGSPNCGDMEDFDTAIVEADLAEMRV